MLNASGGFYTGPRMHYKASCLCLSEQLLGTSVPALMGRPNTDNGHSDSYFVLVQRLEIAIKLD